jgi:hypothetical protein
MAVDLYHNLIADDSARDDIIGETHVMLFGQKTSGQTFGK